MQGEECNSKHALEPSARAAQAAAAPPPPHLQRDNDGSTGAAAAQALGVGLPGPTADCALQPPHADSGRGRLGGLNVVLAGTVDIQDRATVWYGSVLRGDMNHIVLGFSSSIGNKCVLHAASTAPTGLSAETLIGKYCTIRSFSTLRSCTVEDEAVVGQRCVLLEGSLVEMSSMLGSGSVLPPGRRVPARELWAGKPAKFVRMLTNDEIMGISKLTDDLRELAQEHMQEYLPYGTAYLEVEKLRQKMKLLM